MTDKVKSVLQRIFPSPRQPVTWASALPLIVFLVVYAGICLYLEYSNRLAFLRPAAFGLMVFAPWVWWMYAAGFSGLPRARGVISLILRLSLVGLFAMLLAEPRAVRTRDVVSVVYAVDLSDSIDETQTDKALEFVAKTVAEKPPGDEAGLLVFGRTAAVELPPRVSFPFENVINVQVDRDATNIENSLRLAASTLPEENRGRIVLITDGTETDGSLHEVLDDLKSREIAVDILPISYGYNNEVLLERLELPRFVKIGESYEASVVLTSLKAGKGRLVLKENGQQIASKEVEFQAGKNRETFPIKLPEPGYFEYSASIEVDVNDDRIRKNNEVMNYIFVEGEGKVLLVYDSEGDPRDRELLKRTIAEGQRLVEERSSLNFPRDSLSLMPYDAVVFVNAPMNAFDAIQLQALHDAIKNQGVGFLMVGGQNSFGPGGYHRSVIEDALPVTMDITKKKVLPKGALVIILHTCEFPEGNTWAKRITKQAIKVLGAQDEVGAIGYDYESGEEWIFELTEAREYESLVPKINGAQIGDMPSFDSTMQMGIDGLKESDAASRHMIIISDGDPPMPPPEMLQEFMDEQVSVTTVAVFPHTARDVETLRSIANVTGGRFYLPGGPDELPKIFIKEAKTLKRSMVQNKTITPEHEFPDSTTKGIGGMPPLHGFVLTTPKERATTVLKVPPEEEGDLDPILSVWRYGLGTTAAFTSDLSVNWAKDWVDWPQFQAFVKQLMTRIARVSKKGHLRMWSYTDGNDGVIVVEDFHPDGSFLDVTARVAGPREDAKQVTLRQVGPRRYQASVPLWGKGRYQVMAVGVDSERKDVAHGGFIVPYSPEYLKFRSDPIVLNEIADETGGEELPSDAATEVVYGRRRPKRSSWPVFDWFIVALACLVPLDVGIRRVQLDWSVIRGWFMLDRRGESTRTMGTLLQRKQAVGEQIESKRRETPLPAEYTTTTAPRPTTARTAGAASSAQPGTPTSGPAAPAAPAGDTTTSKLLALKRKRDEHGPDDSEPG